MRPVSRSSAIPAVLFFLSLLAGSAEAQLCIVSDDGSGTVELPPAGCQYLSPSGVYLIIDGLPPSTTIEMAPVHENFVCNNPALCAISVPPGVCEAPGGSLGGDGNCSGLDLQLQVTGTGALAGFNRVLSIPLDWEAHTGPRNPGDPVQSFDAATIQMQGQLFGDPDFDTLVIRAGSFFGLPSPGHTVLTDLSNGNFNVDSFFDLTYEIDFVGAPGSVLDGLSGTTQATIGIRTGLPAETGNSCIVTDNGTGTATLPPAGCEYLPKGGVYEIIDGLPPGTTIELDPVHRDFLCGSASTCSQPSPPLCEASGGSLGGSLSCSDHAGEMTITGTGALAGFNRSITIPLEWEFQTGPRVLGDPSQAFPTELIQMQGEIFGDPDFCTLRLKSGSVFGLPSPGFTTLTELPGGLFDINSFFDITYQIEFQGCPGSAIEGFSGTTTGALRIETGEPPPPAQVPLLSGPWILLAAVLLGGSGLLLARRRSRRSQAIISA
jgi:hypothetical protein